MQKKWRNALRIIITGCSTAGLFLIPGLYKEAEAGNPGFNDSKYEYSYFTNSGFDMELTGLYQYMAKDIYRNYLKPKGNQKDLADKVNGFLEKSAAHPDNDMTGILNGKNLILVQMESLDDWLLSEESAPTIMRLMKEGINFDDFYTCLYGSGSTFSTEFAVNTGLYQSLSGAAAYSMMQNHFIYSLPNLLKEQGYRCNSFHENVGSYYNRELMHKVFGYEQYYCTRDYMSASQMSEDDESMILNEKCWDYLTPDEPFFSFIVTYSAHVPYTEEDKLSQYASEKHPEIVNDDEELRYLYSKVRLTDDMFKAMIKG